MKPIVAIVGRPNVGKSTFFNKITGTHDALVDNFPGVTRDRLLGEAVWDGREFTLVDTGGFADEDEEIFAPQIRAQIDQAVINADAVILMLDGKGGMTPFDADMVEMLRAVEKPVFFVVNKIDAPQHENRLHDFYRLGVEPLYPVSAEHGYGTGDFLDDLVAALPAMEPAETVGDESLIRVAVVGKPNAGKSSLVNRLLGEERLVVSDIPGTTRDAIDSLLTRNGKNYRFIDTAGIRRKAKVSRKIEKFSVIKALRSLDRCDVALIMIDAGEGITDQDITIAGYAYERGCGCIFLLNKWDTVEKDRNTTRQYMENLRHQARFLGFAPALTISALTGLRIQKIFNMVDTVYDQYTRRLGTGELNRIMERALTHREPPMHKGKRLRFYYATQVATRPPSFVCFVNYPEAVHFSYQRYLVNQIREESGLDRTPIRLMLRQRTGRIDFGSRKKKQMRKRRR